MATTDKYNSDLLIIKNSPHITTVTDTGHLMRLVLLALGLPSISAVYRFGIHALLLLLTCVAASLICEWGYEKLLHLPLTVRDGSACVTGLILGLNLPPTLPLWMAVIGCFVSIVIVKKLFGGLGRNFANPAIVGRIVLLLSFPAQMSVWSLPGQSSVVDAVTGATPLALTALDVTAVKFPSFIDLFLGNCAGSIGETCRLAILIGGLFLIVMKVISPIIPVSFLGTIFVLAAVYGHLTGADVLNTAMYHLLTGGAVFGAFFCATDYVTSPATTGGKWLFGIGCGLITIVIRLYAAYPEGVSFAILFMNITAPLLDQIFINRHIKEGKKHAKK